MSDSTGSIAPEALKGVVETLDPRRFPDEATANSSVRAAGNAHKLPLPLRLVAEPSFAIRVAKFAAGVPTPLRTRCRFVLERGILPVLAARTPSRSVLFVGCDYYTWHYGRAFAGHDYRTIDPDPGKRRFGAAAHAVDGFENLALHAAPESLDTIVCNGVFGFGLDRREDAERAIEACRLTLKPGGELILGWSDVPARTPFNPRALTALEGFEPWSFGSLGSVYVTPTPYRQTYLFLRKPGIAGGG